MKPIYFVYTKAFSEFSSRMQFIGLSSALLMSPYPELYMTLFFLGRQIGGILVSYVAGIMADRYRKRYIMFFSELVSAVLVLSLLFIEQPLWIVVIAFLLGMTYVFFDVSYRAAIPTMFGEHFLTNINTILVRLSAIMSIIGFSTGGFISAYFSYKYLLVLDGMLYIFSAIVLLKIRWTELVIKPSVTTKKQMSPRIFQSVDYVFLLIIGFFYPLAASAYQYALPLFASTQDNGDLYNGLMWSTVAIGSFLCSWILKKENVNPKQYIISLFLFTVSVSLTFIPPSKAILFLMLLLVGFTEAFVQVNHYTLLQRSPESIRGRLLGLNALATRCGFLTGFSLLPLMTNWITLLGGIWIMQFALMLCSSAYLWKKLN